MKKIVLFMMMCLTGFTASAIAATSTTALQVTATVLPIVQISCTPINFGNVIAGDTIVVTGTVNISAPSGLPLVSIEMDGGLSPNGSTRTLMGVNGERLSYGIYQDSAMSKPWGNGGAFGDTMTLSSVTGTGRAQQFDIYAKLVTKTDTPATDYVDTITVTVNY